MSEYCGYVCVVRELRKHSNADRLQIATFFGNDTVKLVAEKYYDGPDPIGKTHIREGVVVRIVNRPKFTAFKHKNFDFKVLSNIAIEQAIETGAIEKMSDDEISEL